MAGIDSLIEPFESRGRMRERPTHTSFPGAGTTGDATLGALD